MDGAYIIIGGGLLIFLVLAFIVFKQMSRSGEFSKPKSRNYYLGMGMALGMAIGIPLGLLIGFAYEKIALGISIGPALGAGFGTMIGSLMEKKFNTTPIDAEDENMVSGKKAFRGIIAGLGVMVLVLLIIFILIN
jgi:uncharacterized integral membrane protein